MGQNRITIAKTIGLTVLSFCFAACATTGGESKKIEKWNAVKDSEEFKKEKQVYQNRMGGADFCWGIGLDNFLADPNLKPDSSCFYPSSKMMIEEEGMVFKKRGLRQAVKQLRVLQVVPEGFVVDSAPGSFGRSSASRSQAIFIHKTDEQTIVDGSYIDPTNWLVYEYAGAFTYKTLLGSRTVHSFRKVTDQRLAKAGDGLKLYEPKRAFLLDYQLWDWLAAPQ